DCNCIGLIPQSTLTIIVTLMGKPPAMPGRLPEFDICGKIGKPPEGEPLKVYPPGGFQCKTIRV
ncbi:MAG TPA: hypothetical protein PKL48_05110, partial [Thermodesulfobacteriota bacterium]|nr:hypothetical protein [Thermodesulfobacteriota bacterium]